MKTRPAKIVVSVTLGVSYQEPLAMQLRRERLGREEEERAKGESREETQYELRSVESLFVLTTGRFHSISCRCQEGQRS